MQEDTRRVQTAVLGDPDSHEPVVMPLDRDDAMRFRARHDRNGDTFWCGIRLGGCGKELIDRIGQVKIPHFAHHADRHARPCRRINLGIDSADHLYINRALTNWIHSLGLTIAGAPIFEEEFHLGGGCTALVVTPSQRMPLLAVQLSDGRTTWEERDERLRFGGREVQWIFGMNTRAARAALERDGFALRVRCESRKGERSVMVAVQLPERPVEWTELSEWRLTASGVSTPAIESVRMPPSTGRGKASPTKSPDLDTAFTAFPLDVSELVITPKQEKTGVWGGYGYPSARYSIAASALMNKGGTTATVTVVLPSAYAGLRTDIPYQLLGPASIRAHVDASRLTPIWIIDAEGLALAPDIHAPQTPAPPPSTTDTQPAAAKNTTPASTDSSAGPREAPNRESANKQQTPPAPPPALKTDPVLDRREEMRIRESVAKLFARLERIKRTGNCSRGHELWEEAATLLETVPDSRFGYELRKLREYKAWLERRGNQDIHAWKPAPRRR